MNSAIVQPTRKTRFLSFTPLRNLRKNFLVSLTLSARSFLERFSDEAGDIRTHRAGDSRSLTKLILRTYHQHQRDEWASRCLDLIDQMCLEGTYEIRTNLDEYER